MQVDLAALLDLQDMDSAITAVEEQLKALEPEIEALDAELADAEAKLAAARKAAEEADARRNELEVRIESYRVMQERRRQRLEWVRGAKEASAIMAELDLARGVLAKEEADWMRSADKLQEAEKFVEEVEEQVRALQDAQKPAREESREKSAKLEVDLNAAREKRAGSTKELEPKLLAFYERIRRGRAPHALYPLSGGACGHCFTAVPLHLRQQIENSGAVEACEACGVLVYKDTEE